MTELPISKALVGHQVALPQRPEWGVGRVLRVQSTTINGQAVHRVSIQFATGHRTLQCPPARLAEPEAEVEREAGWLDTIGGRTVDDRLVALPTVITEFLGTPAQRLVALAALYEQTDRPDALVHWARRQACVADPLSLWSRDELAIAFRQYCIERDSATRVAAALLKQADGAAAIDAVLNTLPPGVTEAIRAALRQPI